MNGITTSRLKISPLSVGLSFFIILVLFRIPKTLLGVPYLYTIWYSTRTLADQGERFGITVFEVVAIAIGSFLYFLHNENKIRYMLLLGVIVVTNLIRYGLGLSNPISLESYEAFLSLLVAFSCGTICLYFCDSQEKMSMFFNVLVVLFFLSQLYLVVLDLGKNGSYGCLGLTGGGVATCYTMYILLRISTGTNNKYEIALLICAGIGLLLSGSRTNIILMIALINIYYLVFAKSTIRNRFLLVEAIVSSIAIALILHGTNAEFTGSKKINSLLSIFSTGVSSYVSEDASALERTNTWHAALEIIKGNPLGISCSFVDLQDRMYDAGSTTFPHSTLLAYYLLIGIPALFIYYAFFDLLIKSIKYKSSIRILIIFITFSLTFYGGISSVYLSFFWLFMMYAYIKKTLSIEEKQPKESKSIEGDQQIQASI